MKKSMLPLEMVRRILGFDPNTGIFTWVEPASKKTAVGAVAGSIASNGRRYIGILGEKHSAHRLAWFYHYGVWPTANVKQKNGDYDDVKISNLVEESVSETAQRGTVRSTNKSGMKGVSWSAAQGRWVATMTRNYRRLHLGYFDTVEAASAAYHQALVNLPDGGALVPSAEAIAKRRRLRAAWKRALREYGTLGWSSFEVFVVDVAEIPDADCYLRPVDTGQPLGPGNAAWTEKLHTPRSIQDRVRRQENPEIYRSRDLKKNFGISLADYQRMLIKQAGVCAICHQPETGVRNGRLKSLAVDHDHDTGRVRALLCSGCNPMIGYARENATILRAAADYLDAHATPDNVVPLKGA